MSKSAISMKDVWVRYDSNVVLEDINLHVAPGEIISIVGPNGSGKSTLIKTIMGFKEAYKGSISVLGKKPEAIKKAGAIGYLPQGNHYDVKFPINVFDVVAMTRYSHKKFIEKLNNEDREIISGSLKKVDMEDHGGSHFGTLSGGQKQRVLIARALASRPEILILDEPSTGLDAVAQDSFYHLLADLRDSEGLTILMVSHDIGTVSQVVDRLACIKKKIHYHGTMDQCIPDEALTRVFGNNINFVTHDHNCPTCRKES